MPAAQGVRSRNACPGRTPEIGEVVAIQTAPPGAAHLCAAAPIPASSGKVARHRLNRGGDRQANHALWRIVITRMGSHSPARAYVRRGQWELCQFGFAE